MTNDRRQGKIINIFSEWFQYDIMDKMTQFMYLSSDMVS